MNWYARYTDTDVTPLHGSSANQPGRRDDMTELSHRIGLVLHVDESLAQEEQSQIEHALEAEQGITSAHFTERRPHLMLVEYDPDVISSMSVLRDITNQHVHAELIGPV